MAMVQPHPTRVMGDWKGCRRRSPSRQLLQLGFLQPGGTGGVSHPDRQCSAHWPNASAALYLASSRSSSHVTGAAANLRMEQSGEETPARGWGQDLVVRYRHALRPIVTHPAASHPALIATRMNDQRRPRNADGGSRNRSNAFISGPASILSASSPRQNPQVANLLAAKSLILLRPKPRRSTIFYSCHGLAASRPSHRQNSHQNVSTTSRIQDPAARIVELDRQEYGSETSMDRQRRIDHERV
jgi:hypothetical protein